LAIVDSSAQRLLRRGQQLTLDEVASRAQKIRSAGLRLTRLVDSVLNAARLDAGQINVNPVPCNLDELVAEVCERQRELSPGINIRFIAPSSPVTIACDPILIEQVVINLVSNAVKYSGDARAVEVKVWADQGAAHCSVRDWGIGIPDDELPKVFERFYRARTAAGIAGTGIGLNFARQILALHGGDMQVQSRVGEGSTFTFSLPEKNSAPVYEAA